MTIMVLTKVLTHQCQNRQMGLSSRPKDRRQRKEKDDIYILGLPENVVISVPVHIDCKSSLWPE